MIFMNLITKCFPLQHYGTDFIKEMKSFYYAARNKSLTNSR